MLKECKLLVFETLNVIVLYAFAVTLILAPLRFESSAAHNSGSSESSAAFRGYKGEYQNIWDTDVLDRWF